MRVAGQLVIACPLLEISQLIAAARFPLTLTFEKAVGAAAGSDSGELGAAVRLSEGLSNETAAHGRQEEAQLREAMQLSATHAHS